MAEKTLLKSSAIGAAGADGVANHDATVAALAAKLETVAGIGVGGVLSGTLPNPGFASDMATQTELDAHTGNTSNPHAVTLTQAAAAGGDSDDVTEGASNLFLTTAERAKLAFLAVTQGVDLDAIETRVNGLDAAVVLQGEWDASAGTFPGGGAAQAGAAYVVSVGGTVDGVAFSVGDRLLAVTDDASAGTYAGNWLKLDYTDQVLSVAGLTGAISASGLRTALGVEDGATADQTGAEIKALYEAEADTNAFTDAEKAKLAGVETAADVTDAANVGSSIHGATAKATPVNADTLPVIDSAASNALKKLTFTNLKAFLKTYFDTLYATAAQGATADAAVPKASGVGVVEHGATAGTARPAGYAAVHWYGTVEPTNAANNDFWINTTP